jgi:hypothetical protein
MDVGRIKIAGNLRVGLVGERIIENGGAICGCPRESVDLEQRHDIAFM